MGKLNTQAGIAAPDELYEALIEAHRDLGESESRKLDAKLILLLANHIGDAAVVREALDVARAVTTAQGATPRSPTGGDAA